jgi:hypothetical protein
LRGDESTRAAGLDGAAAVFRLGSGMCSVRCGMRADRPDHRSNLHVTVLSYWHISLCQSCLPVQILAFANKRAVSPAIDYQVLDHTNLETADQTIRLIQVYSSACTGDSNAANCVGTL